ncbi:MAG: glycosyltransferase family 39 protein [Candidatus Omnitrophota bacterium]|nr:glycosyltransferase family 39 protein [Candidatus Omnitrophota bacterium]
MPNKLPYKYIILGILFGIICFLKPIIFLLVSIVAIFMVFISGTDSSDRIVLRRLVIVALVSRFLFTAIAIFSVPALEGHFKGAFMENVIGHNLQLFRDFHREILNGRHLADYFLGKYADAPMKEVAHSGATTFLNVGAYFRAWLNLIFGESILNSFVFPLISVVTVIFAYYLAKEIFNRKAAVVFSSMMAVLPSFVVWSCINMRTSIGIIAMLISGYGLIKFSKENNFKFLIYLIFGASMINFAKDKFFVPFIAIIPWLLFLCFKIKFWKKVIVSILMFVLVACAVERIPFARNRVQSLFVDMLSRQKSFAVYEHGSNYAIYDDFFYQQDLKKVGYVSPLVFIKALPKGVAYLLFSPFPWKINNQLRLFSYPQIILWYFLFLFSLVGILLGLRYRLQMVLPILIFSAYWIILLALTMGNEGIAARQRDLVLPFFYLFASAAILHFLGKDFLELK